MSASVAALRQLLEQRFPDATPVTHRSVDQVATGIAELDRALPSGGLPRGRLAVWEPLGGATAILRAACRATMAQGERAVWVDAAHTIAGAFWASGEENAAPVLVRPRTPRHALRAAEELLRSGGFALLVLSGAEPHATEMVRLTRAAREGGAAFVALTTIAAVASLRVESRILPESYRWRPSPFGDPALARGAVVRVRAGALGWQARAEFPLALVNNELRMALDPRLVDRRGTLSRS